LIVSDIFPYPVPSNLVCFCLLLRVDQGLHPCVIRAVRLHKVQKVELVLPELFGVFDLKIEPLGVVVGPVVGLHDQIVLETVSLDGSPQVS
jgi:hypothetical protein